MIAQPDARLLGQAERGSSVAESKRDRVGSHRGSKIFYCSAGTLVAFRLYNRQPLTFNFKLAESWQHPNENGRESSHV